MVEPTPGVRGTITRRGAPDGSWELVTGRPTPALRGSVRAYEGYVETMARPMRRRELPAASVAVILNFGPPYRLLAADDPDDAARAVQQRGSFVAGLDDGHSVTESTGTAHCLQLNVAPLAAWRLFARPMSELAHRVVALEEVLGRDAVLLSEQLAEQPAWHQRFALLDAALAARLAAGQTPCGEIVWAWRQLSAAGGDLPITALRDELGWSAKRLIARFREQIGLPPKQAARLLRFQRAMARLRREANPDWGDFAQTSGFYDQAHLINEFRHFAGDTPDGLLRRHLPADGGFAAD